MDRNNSNTAVAIRNLSQRYGNKTALKDISLRIPQGVITGLIGANGCGKTTLLKILAGLITTYNGEVAVMGQPPSWRTKAQTSYLGSAPYYKQTIKLSGMLDMYERLYPSFRRDTASHIFSRLKLDQNQRMEQLSRGLCAQVLLALALSVEAKLYLLDEPFGGIDINTRSKLQQMLTEFITPDKTFLIATHELHDMEKWFDRVLMLHEGSVVLDDDADTLREQHNKSIVEIVKEGAF